MVCVLGLAVAVSACDDGSSSGTDAGPGPSGDAGPGVALMDAGAPPRGADAGPAGPATDAGPSTGTDAGTPPAGGGAITGTITRSAEPAAGGVGHLYVAVFTSDPVTDRAGAMNVANARIEDVDMSGSGASVPYTVDGIPPRSEPYYVTAFLDDNGTVSATDPSSAGPDRGDLVALDGFSSPQVTVSTQSAVTLDLDLNFNLPF